MRDLRLSHWRASGRYRPAKPRSRRIWRSSLSNRPRNPSAMPRRRSNRRSTLSLRPRDPSAKPKHATSLQDPRRLAAPMMPRYSRSNPRSGRKRRSCGAGSHGGTPSIEWPGSPHCVLVARSSPATTPRGRWRGVRMGRSSPLATGMGRCGCSTLSAATRSATRSTPATTPRGRWRGVRKGRVSPPATWTGRCGCSTLSAAIRSATRLSPVTPSC